MTTAAAMMMITTAAKDWQSAFTFTTIATAKITREGKQPYPSPSPTMTSKMPLFTIPLAAVATTVGVIPPTMAVERE